MAKRKSSKELSKKVGYLNESAMDIQKALKKIKRVYKGNKDMDVFIWRIEKEVGKMHGFIMKQLQKECLEEDFDEAIKGFDKVFKRKNNKEKK